MTDPLMPAEAPRAPLIQRLQRLAADIEKREASAEGGALTIREAIIQLARLTAAVPAPPVEEPVKRGWRPPIKAWRKISTDEIGIHVEDELRRQIAAGDSGMLSRKDAIRVAGDILDLLGALPTQPDLQRCKDCRLLWMVDNAGCEQTSGWSCCPACMAMKLGARQHEFKARAEKAEAAVAVRAAHPDQQNHVDDRELATLLAVRYPSGPEIDRLKDITRRLAAALAASHADLTRLREQRDAAIEALKPSRQPYGLMRRGLTLRAEKAEADLAALRAERDRLREGLLMLSRYQLTAGSGIVCAGVAWASDECDRYVLASELDELITTSATRTPQESV